MSSGIEAGFVQPVRIDSGTVTASDPVLVTAWPKRVTVGNTALLSASVTFPAGTSRVALVPHSTTVIYLDTTTATANSPIVPAGGIVLSATKAVLDALAVYAASGTYLSVYLAQ
jgi:hypothetical protein